MSASAARQRPVSNTSRPLDATAQEMARTQDRVGRRVQRRLMVGDPLPALLRPAELRDALGIDRTTFRELERAGTVDALRVLVAGKRFYSGARLLALVHAHTTDDTAGIAGGGRRFFAAARHAVKRKTQPRQVPRKRGSEDSRERTTS